MPALRRTPPLIVAPRGIDAPDGTKGTFLAAIALGRTIAEACQAADIVVATAYRWRLIDDEFAADWAAALAMRREARADKGWDAVLGILRNPDHPRYFEAAQLAVKHNESAAPATQQVEVSQPAPFVVEHRRGLTVADLLADPRAAGLVQAAIRELPAAGEVLAEPAGRVDPAGDLPAGSES